MSPRYQPPCPDHEGYIPDIRQLPLKDRQTFVTGPTVKIYDGDMYVMDIPSRLFLAATANPRLIDDSSNVRLPPDTGCEAILAIGYYLLALTTSEDAFRIRNTQDFEADLRILKAARLLYLETYITHIHNWYWWKLNNRPINAANVQIVLKVALGSDDPILQLVCSKIAGLIRGGVGGDIDKLKVFVDSQPYLKSIVAREDKRYHTIQEIQAAKAKSVARREARNERGAAGVAQIAAVDRGYASEVVERKAEDGNHKLSKNTQKASARWEKKRKEEAELGRSLQEKMRLGKNVAVLTRAEARYYERNKGKRCPYKVKG
ncbi:uncharacterized protein N0V89_001389 [Didymosphaeria variabile]|uniref:Uncharacterized protein n=1 Tax=Didymosphaeria variabile TaxID=1932322 RepID=A0A9W8XYL3_9PLEO|nr:uncharacterized protein N0V89_001389 [Didymosphaeria variabile]KAJ4360822.1 hypothetical protein N0V89_001389 [Didymosphaeria variabile]